MEFAPDRLPQRNRRKLAWLGGTQEQEEVIVSSGITFHLWRLYQHAWLVCLLFPLVSLMQEPSTTLHLIPGLVALVFFAASYTWLMWPHPVSRHAHGRAHSPLSVLLFVVLVVLTLVFSLVDGRAWLWLFIGVSAIAGMILPMRSAFAAVMLLTLFPLIITMGTSGDMRHVDWPLTIALILLVRGLGLDMIGIARMSGAIRELHAARGELARMAVIEERLRMARDLHDLLGHTLSLVTLKSELAGRLIEQEPARAVQEIHEVEHVARQTLREVREALAGYRHPRLESELEGARQLLSAAGIECSLEHPVLDLPPAIDAVLAWTVREGVTNVIRHSRARQCFIRLSCENGMVRAEVINDGDLQKLADNGTVQAGSGLAGLSERITTQGGRMEAGPMLSSDKEHFRLWVELPIQSTAEETQEEQS